MLEGVLPNQHIEKAIAEGIVNVGDGSAVPPENVQPASLDLRLGPVAYRLRCSFLPGRHTVQRRLRPLIMREVDLTGDGGVLEKARPYLIPLKERLALPDHWRARANPKSSTGRADVFTRVISDRSWTFDDIRPAYKGQLYLEVVPLSFAIQVREDLTLNQLRLSVGHCRLSDNDVRQLQREDPLLFQHGEPVAEEAFAVSNGLFLGLNLTGDRNARVGYRAKENAPLLDLTQLRSVDPTLYWEPVHRNDQQQIILEPKEFYLLLSNEAVRIPPSVAAEMTAYDPTNGELRTHYAGFFDPGFGYDAADRLQGSVAALEVRAHDVPFMIEHGQRVCKLTFERMLEPPTELYGQSIGSNYQRQTDTLGKHFLPPTRQLPRDRRGRRVGGDQLELPVADAETPFPGTPGPSEGQLRELNGPEHH